MTPPANQGRSLYRPDVEIFESRVYGTVEIPQNLYRHSAGVWHQSHPRQHLSERAGQVYGGI